ncbi:MAG: uncharacterized membrane protein YheB (UPF0754 family) [Sulfurimonas sp.]|jgi:uncharacterized membrane protein YheB (UPF0754 family)|uniref:DUF4197 domain-containing protein n=1 Tax=Sulfurimonas sp. TaxID=2022749 RepID=UPI0039E39DEE
MKKILITSALLLNITSSQAFDFGGFINSVKDAVPAISETVKASNVNDKPVTGTNSMLSDSSVSEGLKEALKQGVDYAVKELSKEDGYLNNASVKIPLPDGLSNTESMIRKMGGDKMADDFIDSMNEAAAKAAVKATPIFVNAIDKMSIDDAKKILASNENAATDYFKTHTTDDLKKMMKPIIEESMAENNVASYYDTLNEYYDSTVKTMVENESIRDMAKNFGMEQYMPKGTTDEQLDDYVTRNAIDGLFKMIALKEAEIRKDPLAQSSSLLQKVFGK